MYCTPTLISQAEGREELAKHREIYYDDKNSGKIPWRQEELAFSARPCYHAEVHMTGCSAVGSAPALGA